MIKKVFWFAWGKTMKDLCNEAGRLCCDGWMQAGPPIYIGPEHSDHGFSMLLVRDA